MLATATPLAAIKTARVEARITDEQKALLQRAAVLAGQSLSEFIIHSARAAAERTIADAELIRLTREERDAFVAALLDPPEPSARLKSAAENYRKKMGA